MSPTPSSGTIHGTSRTCRRRHANRTIDAAIIDQDWRIRGDRARSHAARRERRSESVRGFVEPGAA